MVARESPFEMMDVHAHAYTHTSAIKELAPSICESKEVHGKGLEGGKGIGKMA